MTKTGLPHEIPDSPPSTMNNRQTLGIETAFDQIVDECLYDGRVLRRSFDEAKRMLVAFAVDTQGTHQDQVVADVQAVDLDHWKIELRESKAIHSATRSADSATNRREATDFDVPSPVMAWRSPSGSRTARLSLRVDTLISIRFIAQRPSQSSA